MSTVEKRLRRVEYVLVRLATHMPEALPPDAHQEVAEMVREISAEQEAGDRQ